MVDARPDQKRPEYVVELSTRLFCRVEIQSRMVRNFVPSQYPTKLEITTPENAYTHLQPVEVAEDIARVATITARIPWNTREFATRARKIPGARP